MHLSTISLALTRIGMGGPLQGAAMLQDFTSGNQTLDPRITFTRASNATVVGKDGTIQYAPHNLLSYSEQFDNAAWSKSNSTVTANAVVAPDGTTTADSIIVTTGGSTDTGVRITTTQAASTVYTTSVYAKYLNTRYLVIRNLAVGATLGAQWVFFDLINGRVGVTGTGITASITSVGNGWYRCSATATTLSTITNNLVDYRLSDVDGSYTVTTGSNIYLWGAQLNVGALQPYYPTTVKNLLGYTQEFDNAAWTKSNSFVQTNLLQQSENLSISPWSTGGSSCVVTANDGVAPNGTQTATKLDSAAGSGRFNSSSGTLANATAYTTSIFVKLVSGGPNISLVVAGQQVFGGTGGDRTVVFNAATGAFVSKSSDVSSYTITNVGNNWWRVSGTFTTTASALTAMAIYAGSSEAVFYAWGGQVVQGTTAGDYQATYGTAKAVMYQAPDGTMSADKLVEDTANATHYTRHSTSGTVNTSPMTLTVYAKAGERSTIMLAVQEGSPFTRQSNVTFDLLTGTPTNLSDVGGASGSSASITAVGNGWYRCRLTTTLGGSATSVLSWSYVRTAANLSYTGDGTSGVYVWGAQLSDSASLDPYVYNPGAAPAAAAYYGPRFDYDPVTLQPKGLLIEEQRTNLLLQSEQFDNAVWTKIGTVTANESTSPGGTLTADLVVTDGVGSAQVMQGATISSGATVTGSIYLKYNNVSGIEIVLLSNNNTTPYARSTFNIQTGVVSVAVTTANGGTNASSTITPIGNGWYRCSVTVTYPAVTAAGMRVNAATATGSYRAWGAQLEAGSFATSYIPTTAAQVTRAADVATMTGANFSNWYNQSEGTMVVEVDTYETGSNSGSAVVFNCGDGSGNNLHRAFRQSDAQAVMQTLVGGAPQTTFGFGATWTDTNVRKLAYAYKLNDFAGTINNANPQTDTSGTLPVCSQLDIGLTGSSTQLNGHIRRLAYWNRRLSNAELQGVTA